MIERIAADVETTPSEALARLLSEQLSHNKKVLWLVSGGSSVGIAVAAMQQLPAERLAQLCVTLVDDIYGGDVTQSNWYKLQQAGFQAGAAEAQGISNGEFTLEETGERFTEFLEEKLAWANVAVGQFGLGAGYHTGGIQPGSEAAREHAKLALGYQDGLVSRVTVTPALVKRLDVAFINSLGKDKRPLVEHFIESTADITQEPTQALKQAKQTILVSDVLPLQAQ